MEDEKQTLESKDDLAQLSLNWIEIWRLSILHPTTGTFNRIINDQKTGIKWGVIWMAVVTLIAWFVGPQRYLISGVAADNFGQRNGNIILLVGGIVAPLFAVVVLLINAAILHGVANLFGGTGIYNQLVYCWGVMLMPFILLAGIVIRLPMLFPSTREFTSSHTGIIVQMIAFILFIGVNLYQFYAMMVAFSTVEKLGLWKSIGIFIMTTFVIVVVFNLLSAGFQAL